MDIRVSVIPMIHGEAVVMRLLRQNATLRGMAELGMDKRELECFRRVLQLPHGIILVTGPTGSGKTSTLYTALNEINDSVRKIITIEDPVEYQLKGVNQIQVSEKAGLTFARGLRSILRHDPDVILIGEIRDQETAQIAVQASLTGHLVFSTLHTNDAPGAFTRLVDMGVEPYLVASSLEAVLAQRLVRVLCEHCKAGGPFAGSAGVQGTSGDSREHHDLPLGRLPGMPSNRLLRPARHLRVDGHRQRNPRIGAEECFERRDSGCGAPRGHAHAGGRRLASGPPRRHHRRRSVERHDRQGSGGRHEERIGRRHREDQPGRSGVEPTLTNRGDHAGLPIQSAADGRHHHRRQHRGGRPAGGFAAD